MITIIGACILSGCLQDVPLIIGDPVKHYLYEATQQFRTIEKEDVACYVDGVFYQSCPSPIQVKPIKRKPWE